MSFVHGPKQFAILKEFVEKQPVSDRPSELKFG